MKGIPQLTNNWGAMIDLLDAVLVTGFNHVLVLGLSKANATSITATINLGSDHGFIDRQVVRIAGSTNGWDGDYKVLSAGTNSITVECTAEHPSVIAGTATCFTAPLDFEIVHQTSVESTTPKRAYRSTDPESLGLILLVHDFCVSGAAVNGSKFAKVGVVSSMSDIDTITGTQMPYDSANHDANWGWDGTYHGWAKWYYRTSNHSAPTQSFDDSTSAIIGNSPFLFIGNKNSFVFDVDVSDYGKALTYGCVEFLDNRFQGKNCALFAAGMQVRAKQSDRLVPQGRSGIRLGGHALVNYGGVNLNGLIWLNSSGQPNYELCGKSAYMGVGNNTNASSSISSSIVFIPFLISVGDAYIGSIPFIKHSMSSLNISGVSASYGKYISRYYSYEPNTICIKHAYTLEME